MKMTSKTKSTGKLKKFISDAKRNGGLTPRARQIVQEKRDASDNSRETD